ncbi:MAG: hypothetical protein R2764_03950 [Bacteroidales bacterium]
MKKSKIELIVFVLLMSLMFSCAPKQDTNKKQSAVQSNDELDRTVLPIKGPTPPLYTELDVRNATPPPHFEVKAPKEAPNVVIVIIDDLGFAGTRQIGDPWPLLLLTG